MEIRPEDGSNVLATEIADSTGELTALFYGRSYIPGMDCGGRVRFRGRVSLNEGRPVMINPAYELIGPGGQERPAPRRGCRTADGGVTTAGCRATRRDRAGRLTTGAGN